MTHIPYHSDEEVAERIGRATEAAETFPHLSGIFDAVCQEAGADWKVVCGFGRDAVAVAVRRAFAALARELPLRHVGWRRPSFPEIGKQIGSASHSAVRTGYRDVYRDPLAKRFVEATCVRLGVPENERPAWLTMSPIYQRSTVTSGVDDAADATLEAATPTPIRLPPNVKKKSAADKREAALMRRRVERERKRDLERAASELAQERAARELDEKAAALFKIVCSFTRADPERVTSEGQTPFLQFVRQLYVCVARDTSYCGGVPSYQMLGEHMGRVHSAAMQSHRLGRLSIDTAIQVRVLCHQLGVKAPSYAAEVDAA